MKIWGYTAPLYPPKVVIAITVHGFNIIQHTLSWRQNVSVISSFSPRKMIPHSSLPGTN
jgi:hypothetical protein